MIFSPFYGSIAVLIFQVLPSIVVVDAVHDTQGGKNAPHDGTPEYLEEEDLPEALRHLKDLILAQQNDERNLFLGDLFADGDDETEEREKRGLGKRCGNRNPCQRGLDCVSRGGTSWRICLPVTCVEQAAEIFNQPQPGSGTSPLEEFVGNVLSGAGFSPQMMFDTSEMPVEAIINRTTMNRGEDVLKDNNHQHYLNQDFKDAIKLSLINEDKRNPMAGLHQMIQDCFQPFLVGSNPVFEESGGDAPTTHAINMQNTTSATTHEHTNKGTRSLQQDLSVIIFNGVFVEVSALLQFYYGWSTSRVDDGDGMMRDIQVQDVCFGAGTTAGGGVGYNLQIWWNGPSTIRRQLQGYELLPIPFLMADIDAAAGAGIGLSWSTLALLLINRLFIRFYLGAGGGLACSLCLVYLDNGVA